LHDVDHQVNFWISDEPDEPDRKMEYLEDAFRIKLKRERVSELESKKKSKCRRTDKRATHLPTVNGIQTPTPIAVSSTKIIKAA
jgi:hypothetical protein